MRQSSLPPTCHNEEQKGFTNVLHPKSPNMPPTQAAINTIFSGPAATTSIPSEGSIKLYTDVHCNTPLSESPTPLLLGTCFNTPTAGINAVSISSLPSCPDDGTPLLVISKCSSYLFSLCPR
ncbi:hypothetical protein NA56DRAFT_380325 [Hyaloscypha hepaticicola]|uniref:Uncharacterized protein n=1 Tax=Hyaloscypha hepaticicola TaxID=2082293 RepID=A0A2J6QH74_9HELO|nr:hypothetical protein NA56DRAFT_380325 [Hyaloscypha hepaticicola]